MYHGVTGVQTPSQAFQDYQNIFLSFIYALQNPQIINKIGEISFQKRYPHVSLNNSQKTKARKLEKEVKQICILFCSNNPDKDLVLALVENAKKYCH